MLSKLYINIKTILDFEQLNIASDLQSQESDLKINALKLLPLLKFS